MRMLSGRVAPSLLATLAVVGCVRMASPPPEQWFVLGDLKAPLRDYAGAGVSPCTADPMGLVGEMEQMNALLASFLQRTDATSVTLASNGLLLVLAQRELPPALDRYDALATTVAACEFGPAYRAESTSMRARDLVTQSRTRLTDAPGLLAAAKRHRAQEAWRKSEEAARASERASWCPPEQKTIPDVFYAWEVGDGTTEWWFCDGSKVVSTPDGETSLVTAHETARPRAAGYLKGAKKFPASEIRRPPEEARATSAPP